LDPGVGARSHGSEVTHLSATDLGAEVPGRAQQGIRGGADVAGTSEPQILAPRSEPQICGSDLRVMDLGTECNTQILGVINFK
jgi:hypothetical protein